MFIRVVGRAERYLKDQIELARHQVVHAHERGEDGQRETFERHRCATSCAQVD